MKNIIKYTLGLVLFLCLIIGVGLLYLSTPEKVENKSTDMSIASEALYQAYEADEATSNQQYIDKIIQVKGRVAERLEDENGAPVVILRPPNAMAGVLCTLVEEERAAVQELQIGQQITIKGQCTGKLMDVVLNKCIIVNGM